MKLTRLNELVDEKEIIKGRWQLDPNHELIYKSEDKEETVNLKTSLVAAEPDALVFSVTQKQTDHSVVTSLLKLTGAWQADSKNRIVFHV